MFKISVEITFSAAHRLKAYPGNCERIHGHNYTVVAQVAVPDVDSIGIAYDFRILNQQLKEVVEDYDHQLINDVSPFDQFNPSSENLAKYIYQRLKEKLAGKARMISIEVRESSKYSAIYTEDEA